MKLPPADLAALDAWIAANSGEKAPYSRPEAIRHLLRLSLANDA